MDGPSDRCQRRRFLTVLAGLAVLLGWLALLLPFVWIGFCFLFCPTGTLFEFNCRYRIHVGMTLEEVEHLLGPAEEEAFPPEEKDRGPVVEGDRYYCWDGRGGEFHIGIRNGRVSGKWFWAPSL